MFLSYKHLAGSGSALERKRRLARESMRRLSGCHINPAITIAMLFAGKMKKDEAAGYIVAQCIGAVLGAGALLLIASGMPGYNISVNGLGQNGFGAGYMGGYTMEAAFIAEFVLTAVFLLVIFGATSKAALRMPVVLMHYHLPNPCVDLPCRWCQWAVAGWLGNRR